MQAHPQSNPAARTDSAPHTASRPDVKPSRKPQPHARIASGDPFASSPVPSVADHAGLAHDAGNLLGALELYCNLLSLPGVLRPEHRHYATELSLISDRSSELIRRLLALPAAATLDNAQPEDDALAPAIANRSTQTSTEVASAANHLHAHTLRSLTPVLQGIAADAATVTVACPAALPSLNFPAEIIERILINLVRNAAQAIRTQRSSAPGASFAHHGEIRIALTVASNRLQLTVEDNGPGLPQDLVAEFLKPSPLPPQSKRGLGHRIVYELATGSGGQLSIRVRPGNGTVFCIKWPVPHARPHHLDIPSTLSRNTAQKGSTPC